MVDSIGMTDGFRRQLVALVKHSINQVRLEHKDENEEEDSHVPGREIGFMAEDMEECDDATDGYDDLPTAKMDIYYEDVDGKLVKDGDNQLDVLSRRDSAIDADTYVEAEYRRGRWWLNDANCGTTTNPRVNS